MSANTHAVPITTKVDETLRDFLDDMAEAAGISRAELLRRIVSLYRDAQQGGIECPVCNEPLRLDTDQ